jgi:hypothetical protein
VTGTANTAGAIYGTILVTALIAGLSEDAELSAASIVGSVLAVTIVFWLAHAYADSVAHYVESGERRSIGAVRDSLLFEWPLVQSAFGPCAALSLAWLDLVTRDTAVSIAIAVGVVSLFSWGVAIGRRGSLHPAASVGVGIVNAAFGLAMVGLKILVH